MARLLTLWWIPFAAALAVVVAWETNWGEALYSHPVIAPPPEAKAVGAALLPEYKATAGPEAYAEVIDRPLFSPTRRQAPPPPQPEPPKQVMVTGQYLLTGTIQVGDKLYAFLKETKGGKGLRAAQGDLLAGGIKLAKVEPDRVVFTQYDSEEEVKLQVSKSTRATPVAAPPGVIPGAPPQPGVVTMPQPRPVVEQAPPHPTPMTAQPPAPVGQALAPFVPGVSVVPAPIPNTSTDVPRRRGAMP